MQRILSLSRYLVLIAIIGSLLATIVMIIYGGVKSVQVVIDLISTSGSDAQKNLALSFIKVLDIFLLSTVFYIIALGLYELFIDDRLTLPPWLEVHTLDDLKEKLVSVIIILMGVLFLENLITWSGDISLLYLAVSIALVVAALTYFLRHLSGEKTVNVKE